MEYECEVKYQLSKDNITVKELIVDKCGITVFVELNNRSKNMKEIRNDMSWMEITLE